MKSKEILGYMLVLSTFASSCRHSGDLSVKVKENDDVYRFSAHFEKSRTAIVERVINKHIAPTHFESDEGVNFTTMLDDKTPLKIETSPGEVNIEMEKNKQNKSSYSRVKRMCEEIKEVVVKKQ